jgi:hypothetical protein
MSQNNLKEINPLKQKIIVVDNFNEGPNNALEEDSESNSTVETFTNEVKINVKDLSSNSFKKSEESDKEN